MSESPANNYDLADALTRALLLDIVDDLAALDVSSEALAPIREEIDRLHPDRSR